MSLALRNLEVKAARSGGGKRTSWADGYGQARTHGDRMLQRAAFNTSVRQRDGSRRGLSRRAMQHFADGQRAFRMEAAAGGLSKRQMAKHKKRDARLTRAVSYLERRASRAQNVEW